MFKTSRKGVFIVLLAIFLAVTVAVIPDIISEEMRAWFHDTFGEGYQGYLLGFFIVGSVILLFLTTDIGNWLRPGASPKKTEKFNIPPGPSTRQTITQAKTHISQAEPEEALRLLSTFKILALDAEIDLLSSRLVDYHRTKRHGTEAPDQENRTFNRISRDIRDLITVLEKELVAGVENYQTIREYLKKRYNNRLDQKLANRQPVNLRRLVNTEVVPEGMAPAFVTYTSEEISGELLQTFRDARGRLLLVGAPGAGKTTLLLQLVLELLDAEQDFLPVILNLATWSNEHITLEAWLKKILAAEMGVSKKYAAEIVWQNRLLPLFDGFDEIPEEDRLSCLEAINRYGEDNTRQYAISSRKQEFKQVNKAVLVHLPIEVCPLTLEQMKTELQRLWENPDKPERGARILLDAIEKDTLLREATQTPFYFNTLQILFNAGLTLTDLKFKAGTLEGRQAEIKERFVEYELKTHVQAAYPSGKAAHWLSFLASRMVERNMVVFELRDLQYDWWIWTRRQLFAQGISGGIIKAWPTGLIGGIFLGFLSVLLFKDFHRFTQSVVYAMVGSLIGATILGLTISWIRKPINVLFITTKEYSTWSLKDLSQHFKESEIVSTKIGLVLGGCIALIFIFSINIFVGVLLGVIFGVILKYLFWLLFCLMDVIEYNSTNYLQINKPYQRFINSSKKLHFSILQHKLLCYQLRKQGLLPPDLVRFLNEMSLRHLLEFDGDPQTGTGGGSWRFRHRIIQEYFVECWVEKKENPQPESN